MVIINDKIIIEDIDKLKITKVNLDLNRLYFTYDNERYFIIANWDCGDEWFTLYRKAMLKDGKNKIDIIGESDITLSNIRYLLDDVSLKHKNIVYSHIDKEYFVEQLKHYKLIE